MAAAVEANSLSSITNIASNPPLHHGRSSDTHAQPLVLYIARVPGRRDVFLTPLKPREKVVTAEDVQSSLYYVHISSELDAELVEDGSRPSSANSEPSALASINGLSQRTARSVTRPLRKLSASFNTANVMPTHQPRKSSYPLSTHVARKPVLTDVTNSSTSHHSQITLPVLPPRPLPTLPGKPLQDEYPEPENLRPQCNEERDDCAQPTAIEVDLVDPRDNHAREGSTGLLTLIRRDPSTSEQWNVASIHDPPVHEVSSAALLNPPHAGLRVKKGGAPLFLDITSPGYLVFGPTSRLKSHTCTSTSSSSSYDTQPAPEGTFRRRLYMPGSKHADHHYSRPSMESPPAIASNNAEGDMIKSMLRSDNHDAASWNSTRVDRRSKGYTFTSPWDGQCEFGASPSGRSLKCRHSLPGQQHTETVSELRFNLPTSSQGTSSTPTPQQQKRRSYFSAMHRRLHSHEAQSGAYRTDVFGFDVATLSPNPPNHDEDDERMDLSLGQEMAGGGFGGKQAKLGKLIIYSDGFEMLDLLVAANVGLWWRAWERTE